MPKLNTPQRLILALAGVAILVFQLEQFSRDGVEGVGWVLPIVAAVLLVLPAMALLSRRSAQPLQAATSIEPPSPPSTERAVKLFTLALTRARKLHRQLPILFDLPPLQDPKLQQINRLMISSWMQYCLAYTASLALMTEWKRDARFPKKPEYRAVWQMIVEEMIKSEASTAKQHGLLASYDPVKSRNWAMRDMNEAELAMRKFVDRLAANIPDPDAPLIDYLLDKLKAPDMVRDNLGAGLRKFTKETLQEFHAA